MRIQEIINYKKRKLEEEMIKENPDKQVIKRLQKSIERHKTELERINYGKKRRRNSQEKRKRIKERDNKKFRKKFFEKGI